MAKLTLKKLATELNANNIACAIGKNVDKIFLDNIKDGYMAYIFEGDHGFILIVRLRDENNKALDFRTYSDEQKAQCDEYKDQLVAELNEPQIYEFKGSKKKEVVVPDPTPTEQNDGSISDDNPFNE